MSGNSWALLPSASTFAQHTDLLFVSLFILFATISLVVAITILFFCIRYRAGAKVARDNPPVSNSRLEVILISFAVVVSAGIFAWAASDFLSMRSPPADAMEVRLYPKQWMWKFQHADGRREINVLHVPKNRPVKIIMISQDVIHSFFVPAFRIKEDSLPGRYTSVWFTATESGRFPILCSQYCGTNHSTMRGEVVVMEPHDFETWLTQNSPVSNNSVGEVAGSGRQIFEAKGCLSCHASGSSELAPRLDGIWNKTIQLTDGRTVLVDENYLRESMLEPNAKIVKGYGPIMPTFKGLLSEEEISSLIAYIKSLNSLESGSSHE